MDSQKIYLLAELTVLRESRVETSSRSYSSGLHDGDQWTRFEAARRAISQRFGNSRPAPRYEIPMWRSA